ISATVLAAEDVVTFSLNREGMLRLMDRNASFRNYLMESLVKRIQKSNERVAQEYSKSLFLLRRNELDDREKYGELVGNSKEIQTLRAEINQAAIEQWKLIVIDGESGVGKQHVAKRIHYSSSRNMEPVIAIPAAEFNWNQWDGIVAAVEKGTLIITQGEEL